MTEDMQIYGEWEDLPLESVGNQMLLDSTQLSSHWRRCSLTSNFWARYTSLSTPISMPRGRLNRDAVESVLSYLLNELFENCAKFSAGEERSVRYQSWETEDRLVIQMRNHVEPKGQPLFVNVIEELLSNDPDELYFQKLEQAAESNSRSSGLGYLTLMKDYGIRFGFRFSQVSEGSIAVDVQAHVSMKEESLQ